MKRKTVLFFLLALFLCFQPLKDSRNPYCPIRLTTTIECLDLGNNLIAIQYWMEMEVENPNHETFTFDRAEAVVYSSNGVRLEILQVDPDYKTWKLGKEETESFIFSTDIWTYELITKLDDGQSLQFVLVFKLGDKIVAGPYLAYLPKISYLAEIKKPIGLPMYCNKCSPLPPKYRFKSNHYA